jgi:hypothetical protein
MDQIRQYNGQSYRREAVNTKDMELEIRNLTSLALSLSSEIEELRRVIEEKDRRILEYRIRYESEDMGG